MPIPLLVMLPLEPQFVAQFEAAGFAMHMAVENHAEIIATRGAEFRGVLTFGTLGLSAADIDRMPNLEIICAIGAGYENIDVAAARARGIAVTHGPGTNVISVADHAMALLMAAARLIVPGDRIARTGEWSKGKQMRPTITGKKLGILGMGRIGAAIAKRGAGGFDMKIGYHNRRPVEGASGTYFPSLVALAEWADFLAIASPGGPGTRHLVNAEVLAALGPAGYVVNIARGSIIDQAALIEALKTGKIAGAGLDVLDGEPAVPPALAALENVVLSPHIAGRAPESEAAMAGLMLENVTAHFAGRTLLTPVPG
jgi:lactate dehydrogenase-like 2-hydroxyacid dehydrogenase